MRLSVALVVALFLALDAACYDPVHADDVASLGDEAPGVPTGPLHRPGQRCTTCHGSSGPGSPEWSVAGTIYANRGEPAPEADAQITLTDVKGSRVTLTSNAAGNFYIDKAQWDPIFPLKVEVAANGAHPVMTSTIGRDGGCATCHRGAGDLHYSPAVYARVKQ